MKAAPSKAIDPGRVGLSKSTIVAAEWCGRKAVYIEQVRDAAGRRVQSAMPERVIFGVAVDEATQLLLTWHLHGGLRMEELDMASKIGIDAARSRLCSDVIDWDAFSREVEIATGQFGVWLLNQQDLPLAAGIWTQGQDGESLQAKMPKIGKVIGTPDLIVAPLTEEAVIVDVKTGQRFKTARDLDSAEMCFYAALYRKVFPKAPLPKVAYLSYSRAKSEWTLVMRQASEVDVELGIATARTVAASIKRKPEDAPFNTAMCGGCQFAEPITAAGFAGCSIGSAVRREQDNVIR